MKAWALACDILDMLKKMTITFSPRDSEVRSGGGEGPHLHEGCLKLSNASSGLAFRWVTID